MAQARQAFRVSLPRAPTCRARRHQRHSTGTWARTTAATLRFDQAGPTAAPGRMPRPLAHACTSHWLTTASLRPRASAMPCLDQPPRGSSQTRNRRTSLMIAEGEATLDAKGTAHHASAPEVEVSKPSAHLDCPMARNGSGLGPTRPPLLDAQAPETAPSKRAERIPQTTDARTLRPRRQIPRRAGPRASWYRRRSSDRPSRSGRRP
jgi:hypothetical protein